MSDIISDVICPTLAPQVIHPYWVRVVLEDGRDCEFPCHFHNVIGDQGVDLYRIEEGRLRLYGSFNRIVFCLVVPDPQAESDEREIS